MSAMSAEFDLLDAVLCCQRMLGFATSRRAISEAIR